MICPVSSLLASFLMHTLDSSRPNYMSLPEPWAQDAPSVWNVHSLLQVKSGLCAFPSVPIASHVNNKWDMYCNHLSPLLDSKLIYGTDFAWLSAIHPS